MYVTVFSYFCECSSEDNLVTYMKSGYKGLDVINFNGLSYSLPNLGHARQPRSQGLSSLLERRWELVSADSRLCERSAAGCVLVSPSIYQFFFGRLSFCK